MSFFGDSDYVFTRFRADPQLSLAAEVDGKIVGSNFIANWGTVGIFGPLTVRPDFWDKGIAKALLDKTMEIFASLETTHIGLLTFSHSHKHIHLYQKYDFWPRFLTSVMSRPVTPKRQEKENEGSIRWLKYSDIRIERRPEIIANLKSLTSSIYMGLDLSIEIRSVANQKLGDILLLTDNENGDLKGLAICHCRRERKAGVIHVM